MTSSGATLNGTVNPNGVQTSYAFQWGPSSGYGHETPLTSAGSATAAKTINGTLTGLKSGTTYHFRVIAISSAGTSVGHDESLTTSGSAPTPSTAPLVSTGAASNVTGSSVTLSGTENPSGQATQYYFEFGQTDNYGYETKPQSASSSVTPATVSVPLSGLGANTTYHYRLVAVNAGGTALGADNTFKTITPPTAQTEKATQLTATSARVNGITNPEGEATRAYFQYGTTAGYGLQTAPVSIGSGTSPVSFHRRLTDLSPGATYHYRLVTTSTAGTTYGADMTFSLSPKQSQVAFMGRMGFVSPGRVIGVEAGCFGGHTACNGTVTMRDEANGVVIGKRSFSIPAQTGGFQNIKISHYGESLVRHNRVRHLLKVKVSVTTTSGQSITQTMALARWVWR